MKRIAFVIHGKIRNKHKLINQTEATFQGSYKLSFLISEYAGQSVEHACKAAEEGNEYIIAVGGDGSLNEVVNGVMQAKASNKTLIVKVGALPFGTGNDFVKTSKSPDSVNGLKELIDKDACKEIDLGHVRFKSKTGENGSRYFINITDIGLGAEVVQRIGKYSKFLNANLAYMVVIVKTLLSYRNQHIKTVAEEFTFEGKVKNFVVANGKYFGGGIGIAPDADIYDGKFSIVMLGDVNLFHFLKFSSTLKKCKKVDHPQIMYKTAKEITIDSTSTPHPIDMDGEFIGFTPMHAKVQPKAISFLC